MCNVVARWYSDRGPKHPAEIAESFADLALAMVGARRDTQSPRALDALGRPTREILALVDAELRRTDGSSPEGAAAESGAAR
jgi:Tetracyclin repressor-like, C-terminal domain